MSDEQKPLEEEVQETPQQIKWKELVDLRERIGNLIMDEAKWFEQYQEAVRVTEQYRLNMDYVFKRVRQIGSRYAGFLSDGDWVALAKEYGKYGVPKR